jgi:outer membrane immunogenic protein
LIKLGTGVKRIVIGVVVGIFAIWGSLPKIAEAADLPVKARPFQDPRGTFWNGWYVGIEGGWAKARTAQTNERSHVSNGFFDQDGGLVGGTLGYNWQFRNWIVGVETDLAWAHIWGAETDCGPARNQTCPTEVKAFGTVRGRAGMAILNNSMIYVTGGWAYGDIRAYKEGAVITNGEDWRGGWTAGGGFETMFLPHWSFKLEYLYATFPGTAATYTIPASNTPISAVERDMHIVRGGVNWHF